MIFCTIAEQLESLKAIFCSRKEVQETKKYCAQFTKILHDGFNNKSLKDFEDGLTFLQLSMHHLHLAIRNFTFCAELYDLCHTIFMYGTQAVLSIDWFNLSESSVAASGFLMTAQNLHVPLEELFGVQWFLVLQHLAQKAWSYPVLIQILKGDEAVDEDLVKSYLMHQIPGVIEMRINLLFASGCTDMTLNLCDKCLCHRKFKHSDYIRLVQVICLHERQQTDRLYQECWKVQCDQGVRLIQLLVQQRRPDYRALCTQLSQIFLMQDWLKPRKYCCTKTLLMLWLRLQLDEDATKQNDTFVYNVRKVAEQARNGTQIVWLVDALCKLFGELSVDLQKTSALTTLYITPSVGGYFRVQDLYGRQLAITEGYESDSNNSSSSDDTIILDPMDGFNPVDDETLLSCSTPVDAPSVTVVKKYRSVAVIAAKKRARRRDNFNQNTNNNAHLLQNVVSDVNNSDSRSSILLDSVPEVNECSVASYEKTNNSQTNSFDPSSENIDSLEDVSTQKDIGSSIEKPSDCLQSSDISGEKDACADGMSLEAAGARPDSSHSLSEENDAAFQDPNCQDSLEKGAMDSYTESMSNDPQSNLFDFHSQVLNNSITADVESSLNGPPDINGVLKSRKPSDSISLVSEAKSQESVDKMETESGGEMPHVGMSPTINVTSHPAPACPMDVQGSESVGLQSMDVQGSESLGVQSMLELSSSKAHNECNVPVTEPSGKDIARSQSDMFDSATEPKCNTFYSEDPVLHAQSESLPLSTHVQGTQLVDGCTEIGQLSPKKKRLVTSPDMPCLSPRVAMPNKKSSSLMSSPQIPLDESSLSPSSSTRSLDTPCLTPEIPCPVMSSPCHANDIQSLSQTNEFVRSTPKTNADVQPHDQEHKDGLIMPQVGDDHQPSGIKDDDVHSLGRECEGSQSLLRAGNDQIAGTDDDVQLHDREREDCQTLHQVGDDHQTAGIVDDENVKECLWTSRCTDDESDGEISFKCNDTSINEHDQAINEVTDISLTQTDESAPNPSLVGMCTDDATDMAANDYQTKISDLNACTQDVDEAKKYLYNIQQAYPDIKLEHFLAMRSCSDWINYHSKKSEGDSTVMEQGEVDSPLIENSDVEISPGCSLKNKTNESLPTEEITKQEDDVPSVDNVHDESVSDEAAKVSSLASDTAQHEHSEGNTDSLNKGIVGGLVPYSDDSDNESVEDIPQKDLPVVSGFDAEGDHSQHSDILSLGSDEVCQSPETSIHPITQESTAEDSPMVTQEISQNPNGSELSNSQENEALCIVLDILNEFVDTFVSVCQELSVQKVPPASELSHIETEMDVDSSTAFSSEYPPGVSAKTAQIGLDNECSPDVQVTSSYRPLDYHEITNNLISLITDWRNGAFDGDLHWPQLQEMCLEHLKKHSIIYDEFHHMLVDMKRQQVYVRVEILNLPETEDELSDSEFDVSDSDDFTNEEDVGALERDDSNAPSLSSSAESTMQPVTGLHCPVKVPPKKGSLTAVLFLIHSDNEPGNVEPTITNRVLTSAESQNMGFGKDTQIFTVANIHSSQLQSAMSAVANDYCTNNLEGPGASGQREFSFKPCLESAAISDVVHYSYDAHVDSTAVTEDGKAVEEQQQKDVIKSYKLSDLFNVKKKRLKPNVLKGSYNYDKLERRRKPNVEESDSRLLRPRVEKVKEDAPPTPQESPASCDQIPESVDVKDASNEVSPNIAAENQRGINRLKKYREASRQYRLKLNEKKNACESSASSPSQSQHKFYVGRGKCLRKIQGKVSEHDKLFVSPFQYYKFLRFEVLRKENSKKSRSGMLADVSRRWATMDRKTKDLIKEKWLVSTKQWEKRHSLSSADGSKKLAQGANKLKSPRRGNLSKVKRKLKNKRKPSPASSVKSERQVLDFLDDVPLATLSGLMVDKPHSNEEKIEDDELVNDLKLQNSKSVDSASESQVTCEMSESEDMKASSLPSRQGLFDIVKPISNLTGDDGGAKIEEKYNEAKPVERELLDKIKTAFSKTVCNGNAENPKRSSQGTKPGGEQKTKDEKHSQKSEMKNQEALSMRKCNTSEIMLDSKQKSSEFKSRVKNKWNNSTKDEHQKDKRKISENGHFRTHSVTKVRSSTDSSDSFSNKTKHHKRRSHTPAHSTKTLHTSHEASTTGDKPNLDLQRRRRKDASIDEPKNNSEVKRNTIPKTTNRQEASDVPVPTSKNGEDANERNVSLSKAVDKRKDDHVSLSKSVRKIRDGHTSRSKNIKTTQEKRVSHSKNDKKPREEHVSRSKTIKKTQEAHVSPTKNVTKTRDNHVSPSKRTKTKQQHVPSQIIEKANKVHASNTKVPNSDETSETKRGRPDAVKSLFAYGMTKKFDVERSSQKRTSGEDGDVDEILPMQKKDRVTYSKICCPSCAKYFLPNKYDNHRNHCKGYQKCAEQYSKSLKRPEHKKMYAVTDSPSPRKGQPDWLIKAEKEKSMSYSPTVCLVDSDEDTLPTCQGDTANLKRHGTDPEIVVPPKIVRQCSVNLSDDQLDCKKKSSSDSKSLSDNEAKSSKDSQNNRPVLSDSDVKLRTVSSSSSCGSPGVDFQSAYLDFYHNQDNTVEEMKARSQRRYNPFKTNKNTAPTNRTVKPQRNSSFNNVGLKASNKVTNSKDQIGVLSQSSGKPSSQRNLVADSKADKVVNAKSNTSKVMDRNNFHDAFMDFTYATIQQLEGNAVNSTSSSIAASSSNEQFTSDSPAHNPSQSKEIHTSEGKLQRDLKMARELKRLSGMDSMPSGSNARTRNNNLKCMKCGVRYSSQRTLACHKNQCTGRKWSP